MHVGDGYYLLAYFYISQPLKEWQLKLQGILLREENILKQKGQETLKIKEKLLVLKKKIGYEPYHLNISCMS